MAITVNGEALNGNTSLKALEFDGTQASFVAVAQPELDNFIGSVVFVKCTDVDVKPYYVGINGVAVAV